MALLIKATSTDEETAKTLLTLWKGFFMHFAYPGRRATAGNLAFPLSPSEVSFRNEKGLHTTFVIAGTRDPFFQANFDEMRKTIDRRMKADYPELARHGRVEVLVGSKDAPILYLETIARTKAEALEEHRTELAGLERFVDHRRASLRQVYTGPFFEWGIYHIFTDAAIIRKMFPVSIYRADGDHLTHVRTVLPDYHDIGKPDGEPIDTEKINAIEPVAHWGASGALKPLTEAARIIRSKNAGINKITYDIFFTTREAYQAALDSNLFTAEGAARVLGVPLERIIGTYRSDDCHAIKISVHRERASGSPGDRDIFGAQQHMRLMRLQVPCPAGGGDAPKAADGTAREGPRSLW